MVDRYVTDAPSSGTCAGSPSTARRTTWARSPRSTVGSRRTSTGCAWPATRASAPAWRRSTARRSGPRLPRRRARRRAARPPGPRARARRLRRGPAALAGLRLRARLGAVRGGEAHPPRPRRAPLPAGAPPIGLTACAIQRQDPGPLLAASLFSPDSRLRARALRAAGELGQRDRLRDVQAALAAGGRALPPGSGLDGRPLRGPSRDRGALRPEPPAGAGPASARQRWRRAGWRRDKAAAWARDLAAEAPRASLHAAGALGDSGQRGVARGADARPRRGAPRGFAFTMITGADFKKEKLVARPPAGFRPAPSDDPEDDDVAMDPDEHLLWPDVPAVQAWWSWREGTLRPGTRYLLGKPIEATWLQRVLAEASQPLRAAAAIELSMRAPRAPLFEVRARGSEQRKALGASRAARRGGRDGGDGTGHEETAGRRWRRRWRRWWRRRWSSAKEGEERRARRRRRRGPRTRQP